MKKIARGYHVEMKWEKVIAIWPSRGARLATSVVVMLRQSFMFVHVHTNTNINIKARIYISSMCDLYVQGKSIQKLLGIFDDYTRGDF